MNPHVNTISNRLSLRPPQRDSLEILARVCEIISLQKDGDTSQALETIKMVRQPYSLAICPVICPTPPTAAETSTMSSGLA